MTWNDPQHAPDSPTEDGPTLETLVDALRKLVEQERLARQVIDYDPERDVF